ncbi:MAG: prepilin-type N-terminal cleavage/methylation domain-containing protein [Fimbriimonadia bacterium]|nr:prepilin-type N-terminal cleavage/methylation domain-containing protein [Fimbriimonadia bacterium]
MRKRLNRIAGFTLIEIMVVIFILAILLGIGFPSWMYARTKSQAKTCQRNLSKIQHAKEQWAMENRKVNGDTVTMGDIVPDYLKNTPTCASGGTYSINNIGTDPTCSNGGDHAL